MKSIPKFKFTANQVSMVLLDGAEWGDNENSINSELRRLAMDGIKVIGISFFEPVDEVSFCCIRYYVDIEIDA